jgi:hypothetical protein
MTRYRRLTVWNKIALWGSLASIMGLVAALIFQYSNADGNVPLERIEGLICNLVTAGQSNDPEACLVYFEYPVAVYFTMTNASRDDVLKDREDFIAQWPIRHYSLTGKPQVLRKRVLPPIPWTVYWVG